MPAEHVVAPAVVPPSAAQVTDLQHEIETLRRALQSRTEIGIAVGMLAERYGCGSDRAWALLTRVSSHSNRKVRDVARVLVREADGTTEAADAALLTELAEHLPGLRSGEAALGD